MGQAEILQIMKKDKNKWFKSREFEKLFNQSKGLISRSLLRLYKSGDVKRREFSDGYHSGYEYKLSETF